VEAVLATVALGKFGMCADCDRLVGPTCQDQSPPKIRLPLYCLSPPATLSRFLRLRSSSSLQRVGWHGDDRLRLGVIGFVKNKQVCVCSLLSLLVPVLPCFFVLHLGELGFLWNM
jgi:hypothetical protein